jgi:type III secretion system YscD/HrpQ family protein
MSESQFSDRIILKILSGHQAGAEVSLAPGEYTIGSGSNDDIQFIDVSLKPGHAKLRVAPNKFQIAAGTGTVSIGDGHKVVADSEWQEVEPLAVVTVAMVRFVLGQPNANWATLTDDGTPQDKKSGWSKRFPFAAKLRIDRLTHETRLSLFAAIVVGAVLTGIAIHSLFSPGDRTGLVVRIPAADVERIARETLDQFPFGKQVALKREVDGTIYAIGFVKDGFERRALADALEKAGLPVYLRLGVLDALSNEVSAFINAGKVPVVFTLSTTGVLTLEGVILNEDTASTFVRRIKEAVVGLNRVESKIRTGKSLLDEVRKLGRLAQIDQFVVFRLDRDLIEVSGAVPISKTDAWVGFLQSYIRHFSKSIGLRILVYLQNADGTPVANAPSGTQAITINGPGDGNDTALDGGKVLRGEFGMSDIFAGQSPASNSRRPSADSTPKQTGEGLPADRAAFNPFRLAAEANKLIASWVNGQLGDDTDDALTAVTRARAGLDGGDEADRKRIAEIYLPLFSAGPQPNTKADACRPGSSLTSQNIPTVLFWLDLLSVSFRTPLWNFTVDEQALILEAALDPSLVASCLARDGSTQPVRSLYLAEAARNPGFVRFVTRKFQSYPLDVSGASLIGQRYIQTRNGPKMREGEAPDGASRLAVVGELGAAIRGKSGYSTIIYESALNWLNQNK